MEYQRRFKKVFDKTTALTHFEQGDMILCKFEATKKKVGKLDAVWEESFWVVRSYNKLETTRDKEVLRSWNAKHLRRFYL
jgi:hypothetical protein